MNERARRNLFGLWLAAAMVWAGSPCDAGASTIYTYMDDKGNMAATDSLASVPERYRAGVKVREVQDGDPVVPAPAPEVREPAPPSAVQDFVFKLAEHYPKAILVPGTNAFQSLVLIVGIVAAVLMLAGMNLSGNPAVRLFMKFMLGFLVVTATYLMYFSDMGERAAKASGQPGSSGNVMQKARESAKTQEAIHQQRAKEIESLEPPAPAPK